MTLIGSLHKTRSDMEDTYNYTKGSVKWDMAQAVLEGENKLIRQRAPKWKIVDSFSFLPFPTINPEVI